MKILSLFDGISCGRSHRTACKYPARLCSRFENTIIANRCFDWRRTRTGGGVEMSENRLKFRVYDIRRKVYFNDPVPPLNSDGTLAFQSSHPDFQKYYITEFCTGVKDTNDNLIYENDIVEQSPSGNKYKIIWIDTDCGWGLENIQTGFIRTMNCFDGDELEIISNIHEQAEQKDIK